MVDFEQISFNCRIGLDGIHYSHKPLGRYRTYRIEADIVLPDDLNYGLSEQPGWERATLKGYYVQTARIWFLTLALITFRRYGASISPSIISWYQNGIRLPPDFRTAFNLVDGMELCPTHSWKPEINTL